MTTLNRRLLTFLMVLSSLFPLHGMLTKARNVPKRAWTMPSFQRSLTGVRIRVAFEKSGDVSWRKYVSPSARSLTALIPFTQAYYDYNRKDSTLLPFRNLLDGWEKIICSKYYEKQEKDKALEKLISEMRSFNLQSLLGYKTDIYIYAMALLNRCFIWLEENKDTERSRFLDALINYIHKIDSMRGNIDYNTIMQEYPFLFSLNERIERFKKDREKKQWYQQEQQQQQQQEQWKQQQYQQQYQQSRQQQYQQWKQQQYQKSGQQQSSSTSSIKGSQTKKILGLPESASDAQVKIARNKFLLENHPDVTKNLVAKKTMTPMEAKKRADMIVDLNRSYAYEYESHRE